MMKVVKFKLYLIDPDVTFHSRISILLVDSKNVAFELLVLSFAIPIVLKTCFGLKNVKQKLFHLFYLIYGLVSIRHNINFDERRFRTP
jgi:hypothetical protein